MLVQHVGNYVGNRAIRFHEGVLLREGEQHGGMTDRIEAAVLARITNDAPADGSTRWSTRKIAADLGGEISHMTVARIWAKNGIKPQH